MNNRINELADQAGFCGTGDALNKFAELIVRECIANCDDLNSMKYIANHFEIEIKGLE